jgi:MYXO-CTERM domain-containing protein
MKFKYAGIAAALLFAGLANGAAADERINNGTFTGGLSGWSSTGVVNGADDALYTTNAGASGSSGIASYAAFGGGNATGGGSLFQTFATVVGQAYTLTFNFAGFGSTSSQLLSVTASDATTNATIASTQASVKASKLSSNLTDIFEDGYLSFVATSALTKLTFADISAFSLNADMLLANVSVQGATPVPGPEAGAGLGALAMGGLALYLRRRKNSATAA